ncbi:urea ABC transporter permease subunit UrtC [Pseudomonas sp. 7P_10.2_Bac1]|uniref:urea ABC transporter permease subunit UrtC n=1 Tax=Pseudomonas sp. 7P_10.2_Bac1 TaxID=2971614 RepID=UPI0021C7FBE3|nr:urea ABC transporter permease subunit UrtC [Pseudomonas sp. 7P_10.2_Bac1]MCU1727059.1 urea ABC transporter permease subunit UrtC [Pseudomonas sp. 7P_10.2_Bac1]
MLNNLYHDRRYQWSIYLLFFALLAVIPLYVTDAFVLNQFALYGVFGLLAVSISLCWGTGGILNLGQGVMFGLSAYGMAMTMQMQSQDPVNNPIPPFMLNNGLDHLPWFWTFFDNTGGGIFLSLALPTLFCLLFGGLMFQARVSGPFFAIISLAMLSAIATLVLDVQPYTNGANGISPPMPLQVFGRSVDPYAPGIYWLVFALLAGLTITGKLLTQSKFGQIVQALKNDPERVRFLGYNVALYETLIYTISGFIAAVAGCCFTMIVQYVSPAQFDVAFSITMVIWAGVGGRLSLLGSIIGALLIQGGQSYLGDSFLNSWILILGLFFIVVVRFLPKGLTGLLEAGLARLDPKRTIAQDDASLMNLKPGDRA